MKEFVFYTFCLFDLIYLVLYIVLKIMLHKLPKTEDTSSLITVEMLDNATMFSGASFVFLSLIIAFLVIISRGCGLYG